MDADISNTTTFSVKPLGVISTHNGTTGAVRNTLDDGSGHASVANTIASHMISSATAPHFSVGNTAAGGFNPGGAMGIYYNASNQMVINSGAGLITQASGVTKNILDDGSGGMTVGTLLGITGVSSGEIGGNPASAKNITMSYDIANNRGLIEAIHQNNSYRPIYININGGAVVCGGTIRASNNYTDEGNNTFAGRTPSTITSGTSNVGIGGQVLTALTTGQNNIAAGYTTLQSMQTGSENIGIGLQSLLNCTSSYNIGIGRQSGLALTSGSSNTFIGDSTNCSLVTAENSTALGNGAVISASNQIVLGNASVTSVTTAGTVTSTGAGFRVPSNAGSLNFNTTVQNKIIALYDPTPLDNTRHDYYGFGVSEGTFRYQTPDTNSDHVFYASTSSSTSNLLARISGAGVMSVASSVIANGENSFNGCDATGPNNCRVGFIKKSGVNPHITSADGIDLVFSKLSTSSITAANISSGSLTTLWTMSNDGALTGTGTVSAGTLTTTGAITPGAAIFQKSVTVADGTTQTLDSSAYIWNFTGTSTMVCTLPAANAYGSTTCVSYLIINNHSSGTITISRAGSDTIDGSLTTKVLSTRYDRIQLQSDGISNYYTV